MTPKSLKAKVKRKRKQSLEAILEIEKLLKVMRANSSILKLDRDFKEYYVNDFLNSTELNIFMAKLALAGNIK